jgi:hypothetical protein
MDAPHAKLCSHICTLCIVYATPSKMILPFKVSPQQRPSGITRSSIWVWALHLHLPANNLSHLLTVCIGVNLLPRTVVVTTMFPTRRRTQLATGGSSLLHQSQSHGESTDHPYYMNKDVFMAQTNADPCLKSKGLRPLLPEILTLCGRLRRIQ